MDDELKPQKKQVCRFFTSKGECYTKLRVHVRSDDASATIFDTLCE
jgi:hypothetical protein